MKDQLNILHIEDTPEDRELIRERILADGIDAQFVNVDTREDLITALEQNQFDVVLADYSMPSFDGLSALKIVREKYPHLPVIFLSGTMGEELAVECLKNGATDYVLKNRLSRLSPAIRRAMNEVEELAKRKTAEDQLRKLSRAVEQSANCIVITDLNGDIEYVNPKFVSLTGYTTEELIGKNPRILQSGETPDSLYDALWETITSGNEWQGEFHNQKKNGELYWESASISPIRDESGRITHFVGVKEDITQRKNLENQVQQIQKMELLGNLTGGIAHDFNNLLTVICDNMEMLLSQNNLTPDMLDALADVYNAGKRGAALTSNLLLFSRKTTPHFEVLDVHRILDELLKMLKRVFDPSVTLEIIKDALDFNIVGDASQIHQLIMNLAVNARDAMLGGGKLILKTKNITLDETYCKRNTNASPGDFLVLSISDNGLGMDAETQKHIFEPFFTTKEVGKGTGLGLAVVYGVVKGHHGWINLYSEKGQGTTFKIYFPLNPKTNKELLNSSSHEQLPTGTETILLVDDDLNILKLGNHLLTKLGYQVMAVNNGKEAIQLYQEKKSEIQLVITDLLMPNMNGRELINELTTINPMVKIILATGADIAQFEGLLKIEGIKCYLTKPYRITEIAHSVRKILDE